MKFRKTFTFLSTLVMLVSVTSVLPAGAAPNDQAGDTPYIRQISSSITTSFPAGNSVSELNGVQMPEIRSGVRATEEAAAQSSGIFEGNTDHPMVDRSESREHKDKDREDNYHKHGPLTSPWVRSSKVVNSNPGLFASFNGLNHPDQRLANGGNQFSVEPPDQGLCVGNGYVMETVNTVMNVFDTDGNSLTGVIDLNSFYGYPAQIDRTNIIYGPFITDPSCYYDPDTQRWFHVVLTLDLDPSTGDFLGPNHLDIAVSTSDDPTGSWVVYKLPVQNDGTDGTPNHNCVGGPCIGDYPHIGADKYGFYITTNEYDFFGPNYKSAQVYAFPKAQLAANASTVTVVEFDTTGAVKSRTGRQPGFTVWPAFSPASKYNTKAGGTEFFLSSNAGEEANGVPGGGFSNELIVWALTNTKSLNSNSPHLTLRNKVIRSEVYGIPPKSDQKSGDIPLAECVNDTTLPTPFGPGCWQLFFVSEPVHDAVLSPLDSNDTRMQQVWYAQGKLWGALDTVVTVHGQERAGIAYFVVNPKVTNRSGRLSANIQKQGYVAVKDNNVIYPAIAVLPNGKGIMAFTLVGEDHYPSAAYVSINKRGTGKVHVAAAGLGPQDGFSEYNAFASSGVARPRWGDYGAAVTDGRNIWIASEYIAQTCTYAEYTAGVSETSFGAFGSCDGTRTSLGNWATRISGVKP